MAFVSHTYGPTCLLRPDSAAKQKYPNDSEDPPKIRAQFFYSSALPIDDPLSPVPPIQAAKSTAPSRVPPKAFSLHDNIALEEAWQKFQEKERGEKADARQHEAIRRTEEKRKRAEESARDLEEILDGQGPQDKAGDKQRHSLQKEDIGSFKAASTKPEAMGRTPQTSSAQASVIDSPIKPVQINQHPGTNPLRKEPSSIQGSLSVPSSLYTSHGRQSSHGTPSKHTPANLSRGSTPSQRDTSGTPFARVPSRGGDVRNPLLDPQVDKTLLGDDSSNPSTPQGLRETGLPPRHRRGSSIGTLKKNSVRVPVGVSRLHFVQISDLQMGPLYWDPVHDVSSVVRGTWFYKDSMTPVEPNLANQLEEGYEYMKPWTSTYRDELNSCLSVGPEGELKVCHRLWSEAAPAPSSSRPATAASKQSLLDTKTEVLPSNEKHWQRAMREAKHPDNRSAGVLASQKLDGYGEPTPLRTKDYVMFANHKDAQILRPNQLPSTARGRRPLEAIRKGKSIGIPVVRGFDHKVWEKMNIAQKRQQAAFKTRRGPEILRTLSASADRKKYCGACLIEGETPNPTDLVLVIHGIGQKYSERDESFNFTHSINDFRRRMNEELESEPVRPFLRPSLGNIMVLPVNWRAKFDIDDEANDPTVAKSDMANQYTLGDITAESIPAVRSLVSDILLDIPYYLSHHKSKMIKAVTQEANRIYRLWCQHNPGFHQYGNVHLLAHSLGSVMATDILSKQPTSLPRELGPTVGEPSTSTFDFNTKNLFFCGSPAGFFLLLNKAPLLPRKGRHKPACEDDDSTPGVAGEAGTYGCLAVDNIYNILHYNDPVACLLNACVDAKYAASLAPARIPLTTTTWLQSLTSVFSSSTNPTTKPISSSSPSSSSTRPKRTLSNSPPPSNSKPTTSPPKNSPNDACTYSTITVKSITISCRRGVGSGRWRFSI